MRAKSIMTTSLAVLLVLVCTGLAWTAEVAVSTTTELNDALDSAMGSGTSDTINIAVGTYNVTSVLNYYKTDEDALALIGAGPGATILDGGGITQILHIDTTGGTGQTSQIIIRDMTFQNGSSSDDGGAVYAATNAAGLIVDNVEFLTNTATDNGGGLYFTTTNGLMTISSSVFDGNQATGGASFPAGGGLWGRLNFGTEFLIEDSEFSSNTAQSGSGGGATFSSQGSGNVTVDRCIFLGNSSGGQGGGLNATVSSGNVEINNSLFARNGVGNSRGGGFHSGASSGTVTAANNTVTANSIVSGNGGGISLQLSNDSASADITNNIIFANLVSSASDDAYINDDADNNNTPNPVTISHNDYQILSFNDGGAVTSTGNSSSDPGFLDAGSDNYQLSSVSLAIDAGDNTASVGIVDLAGNDRRVDDPNTVDTGSGTAPIVDMGAYEFQVASSSGGGCNTAGKEADKPLWLDLAWLILLGVVFVLWRRKVLNQK